MTQVTGNNKPAARLQGLLESQSASMTDGPARAAERVGLGSRRYRRAGTEIYMPLPFRAPQPLGRNGEQSQGLSPMPNTSFSFLTKLLLSN